MKKIDRRSFLKATALSFAALGLAACGSTGTSSGAASGAGSASADASSAAGSAAGGKEYKVGIINYMDHASLNQIVSSVEAELDALGSQYGCTFSYADYYDNAQADATLLNQIAANLVADGVDAIVAVATPAALAVQSYVADQGLDTPIIYSAVSDPESAGLTGLDNVTGTSDALNTDAIISLILAAKPDAKKIGLLYDLGQESSKSAIESAKACCEKNGLAYVEANGTTTAEVQLAAESLVAEGVDAVFTPTDNTIMSAELAIYETFAEAGIPHFGGADSFALNGAFCGYGVDYVQLGTATADLVGRVLAGGEAPADIPYETFDNGIATVNTEICAQLGLDMNQITEAFTPYCTSVEEITTAEAF